MFVAKTSPVKRVAMFATPIFLTAVAVFFVLATRPNIILCQLLALVDRFRPNRHSASSTIWPRSLPRGQRDPQLADLAAVVASFASWMVEASVY
ncbi:MAG: hypothetical protein R3E39_28020 [Anaerolineae bacterium]